MKANHGRSCEAAQRLHDQRRLADALLADKEHRPRPALRERSGDGVDGDRARAGDRRVRMVVRVDESAELAEELRIDRLPPPLLERRPECTAGRFGRALEQLADEGLEPGVQRGEVRCGDAFAALDAGVEELGDRSRERAARPVLVCGVQDGHDHRALGAPERSQQQLPLAPVGAGEPLLRAVDPLRRRCAPGSDRAERTRAEVLGAVTRRECERVVRDAVRIAEQLDQLREELVVLQLVRVEPLVVLAQLLRQSLRLGETIGFGRRHRTVLYSKRAGRARPPSGSWRPGRRICFDGLQVRRVLLSLQLVALVVGLTACGGDTLALDPAASAATKTVEAGSSRVEFEIAMKVAGESMDMTGSGAFDYRDPRGEITYRMDVPVLGEVSMDLRMIGTKLYVRLPQEIAGSRCRAGSRGRPWISASRSSRRAREPRLHAAAGSRADAAEPPRLQLDVTETGTATSAASRRRATSAAWTAARRSTPASTTWS